MLKCKFEVNIYFNESDIPKDMGRMEWHETMEDVMKTAIQNTPDMGVEWVDVEFKRIKDTWRPLGDTEV